MNIEKSEIMFYVKDASACKSFWLEKMGFALLETRPFLADMVAYALAPTVDSDVVFVLMDRDAVAKVSPEVNLGMPSVMFRVGDVAGLREKLKSAGVTVSEVAAIGDLRTINFCDCEGNYYAAASKS